MLLASLMQQPLQTKTLIRLITTSTKHTHPPDTHRSTQRTLHLQSHTLPHTITVQQMTALQLYSCMRLQTNTACHLLDTLLQLLWWYVSPLAFIINCLIALVLARYALLTHIVIHTPHLPPPQALTTQQGLNHIFNCSAAAPQIA